MTSEESTSNSEKESTEELDENQDNQGVVTPLKRIVVEIFNIPLIRDGYEDLVERNWYAISRTALYIGFIGLAGWSIYFSIAWGVVYLTSSNTLFGTVGRITTVGPLAPVAVFIFALISKRSAEGIENLHASDESSKPKFALVIVMSTVSLFLAITYRWSIFNALTTMYGNSVPLDSLISIVLVDGLYISLILIGVGGLASLIFAPTSE
ncbi:hypothetical protein [Halobellus ordinarius]|uniref:hypothetical protein n=1 Tax=Halobellus ordinarius TaxID=3075120 RepID=UPI002880B7CC|nr:hypothetical protein [Halobellus sp. ZY16]